MYMRQVSEENPLWPPSFSAAIFDFDDTLALTHDLWRQVDMAFLGARGIRYTPDVGRTLTTLGFAGGARWCIERYGLEETVEEICDEWNAMGRALYATKVRLRPGAREYLAALRSAGVPIALATTNDPDVLASMGRNVDVYTLFDAVVCAKEVGCGKDRPDIYLEAARRISAQPKGCMVFEDLLQGICSAKRAGMRTCAVLSDNPLQNAREVVDTADCAIASWREALGDDKR